MPIAYDLGEASSFIGRARHYRLDPPVVIDGRSHEYVVLAITPRMYSAAAEIRAYPATEFGTCAEVTLSRRVGSFTLRDDYTPGDEAYEDGVRWLSLQHLGGYEVEQ
ncbi:hypothetical protein [Nocardia sp. NPDC057227]|uniref:hypothetical protein n=1 Tax=Nocardia sp. NPDC057227 TaxID=3346056 RepID=UPI0036269EBF